MEVHKVTHSDIPRHLSLTLPRWQNSSHEVGVGDALFLVCFVLINVEDRADPSLILRGLVANCVQMFKSAGTHRQSD